MAKKDNIIAPSILSADFAKLGEEVESVLSAGADWVHFDVMDNHYVPNLTIGPMVCSALREYGIKAPIDVHLMVQPVDRLIDDFVEAGATYITFHPEASQHIDRSLQIIKSGGCKSGLVLNPASPINLIEDCLESLDMILLMSVNPGFGGQKFIPSVLNNLRKLRKIIDFLIHPFLGDPPRGDGPGGPYSSHMFLAITRQASAGEPTGFARTSICHRTAPAFRRPFFFLTSINLGHFS